MAKQSNHQDPADVVIFFARARGAGSAVAQSIEALANAFQQSIQAQAPPQIHKAVGPRMITGGSPADEKTRLNGAEPLPSAVIEEDADAADPLMPEANGRGKRNPKTRKGPAFSFVKDLDLRPTGKPSLKDFYAQKSPADQQEILAVVVYYMSKIVETQNIGINHVYTAIKEIGAVKVPTDIAKVARNTSERKGWVDCSNMDNLMITTPGENFVEHDLPASPAGDSSK